MAGTDLGAGIDHRVQPGVDVVQSIADVHAGAADLADMDSKRAKTDVVGLPFSVGPILTEDRGAV